MRPNIDDHDYQTKMRAVNRFLDEGDKVKLTMRFRGREMAHQEIGLNVLKRVQDELAEVAKVEAHPQLEGRQMHMVVDTPCTATAQRCERPGSAGERSVGEK